MAVMPPKWAQDCQQGQWVLFFDELTTCPPPVQAAMLGVIAENRVGDTTLPDTVWKVAACNPPDCAANRLGNGAALGQSDVPPAVAEQRGRLAARDAERVAISPSRSFTLLPADWEKHVGRNTSMIAAFHEHKPGLLEAYPKERAKASGPWSPR